MAADRVTKHKYGRNATHNRNKSCIDSSSSDNEEGNIIEPGEKKVLGLKGISKQVFKLLKERGVTTYKEIANLITQNSKSQIDEEILQCMNEDM